MILIQNVLLFFLLFSCEILESSSVVVRIHRYTMYTHFDTGELFSVYLPKNRHRHISAHLAKQGCTQSCYGLCNMWCFLCKETSFLALTFKKNTSKIAKLLKLCDTRWQYCFTLGAIWVQFHVEKSSTISTYPPAFNQAVCVVVGT